jgi:hypothetical protein
LGVGNAECATLKAPMQSMASAMIRNPHPILQICIPNSLF